MTDPILILKTLFAIDDERNGLRFVVLPMMRELCRPTLILRECKIGICFIVKRGMEIARGSSDQPILDPSGSKTDCIDLIATLEKEGCLPFPSLCTWFETKCMA